MTFSVGTRTDKATNVPSRRLRDSHLISGRVGDTVQPFGQGVGVAIYWETSTCEVLVKLNVTLLRNGILS